jgi:hypothetical protein
LLDVLLKLVDVGQIVMCYSWMNLVELDALPA